MACSPGNMPDGIVSKSAARVLTTAELLELILLSVDLPTVLKAHRVSKMFNATIESSLHLQRALWLKHDAASPPYSGNDFEINPFFGSFATKQFRLLVQPKLHPYYLHIHQESFRSFREKPGTWRSMQVLRVPAGVDVEQMHLRVASRFSSSLSIKHCEWTAEAMADEVYAFETDLPTSTRERPDIFWKNRQGLKDA